MINVDYILNNIIFFLLCKRGKIALKLGKAQFLSVTSLPSIHKCFVLKD